MPSGLRELVAAVVSSVELSLLVKVTLVLLGALALLLVMPRARASVRYLVIAAVFGMLLLLPATTALMPTTEIGLVLSTSAPTGVTAAVTAAVPPGESDRVSEPGPGTVSDLAPGVAESITRADAVRSRPLDLLRAVWLAGGLLFAAPMLFALARVRSLRRTAEAWPPGDALARQLANEAGIVRRVQVLRHEGVAAPMTCGFFRPLILLPWDAPEWAEADLRRALIHELEHVRRADWLGHLLARCVCVAYWFHPLVWTCWRHLRLEAERACDDAVVRATESRAYAAQLVRLAERMSDAHTRPFLAMASPGDLAVRVRSVLATQRRREGAGALWTTGTCAAVLCSLAAIAPLRAVALERFSERSLPPVMGSPLEGLTMYRTATPTPAVVLTQQLAAPVAPAEKPVAPLAPNQAPPEERFAIATVRRGITVLRGVPIPGAVMATVPRGRALGMVTFNEDEFVATAGSIRELIERAYGIGMIGNRPKPFASIEGIPSWTEVFDIDARMPRPIARVAGLQEAAELRAMLQHLLADRFQMVTHWEPREKIVYELLRDGPLGPQLQPSADCPLGKCLPSCVAVPVEVPQMCQGNPRSMLGRDDTTRSHLIVGMPLSQFVGNLQLDLRRPVIDRTGLEGPFNLELRYSSPRQNGADVTVSAVPPNQQWQVFSDALREQLGLRLEPRTVAEDVLVIDRIALPSYDAP